MAVYCFLSCPAIFAPSQTVTSESGNNPPIQPPSGPVSVSPHVAPLAQSFPALTQPPQSPTHLNLPGTSAAATCPSPFVFTPTSSNLLTLLTVTISSHIIYVLPLSLPASPVQPPP